MDDDAAATNSGCRRGIICSTRLVIVDDFTRSFVPDFDAELV
jgi:hypothetical protein